VGKHEPCKAKLPALPDDDSGLKPTNGSDVPTFEHTVLDLSLRWFYCKAQVPFKHCEARGMIYGFNTNDTEFQEAMNNAMVNNTMSGTGSALAPPAAMNTNSVVNVVASNNGGSQQGNNDMSAGNSNGSPMDYGAMSPYSSGGCVDQTCKCNCDIKIDVTVTNIFHSSRGMVKMG